MDVIQEGEYIRTWDGIKKIIKVNEGRNITYRGKYLVEPQYRNSYSINAKHILKHSFSIIDLVEVGDYVNGQKIVNITKDPFVKNQIDLWTDRRIPFGHDYEQERFIEKEIEDIVTKDQFDKNKFCPQV